MDSLPARPPAQRRSSPVEIAQAQATTSPSPSPARARSEDSRSQTIFLQKEQDEEENVEHTPLQQQAGIPPFSEEAPKCWICLLDATEDLPDSSPWRSPCPCALVAHESCLLDWIADVQAPSKHPRSKPPVFCPQCKSQIHLQRSSDPLVSLFQAAERSISYSFPKVALLLIGGVVYGACAAGGIHTIYTVFGPDEGARILAPVRRNAVRAPVDAFVGNPGAAAMAVWGTIRDHLEHWRLYVGLPLIPPTLILSRTGLADGLLPILPVLFFATQQTSEGGDLLQWPPSAEFAFAVLPYVRGLYNAWYKRTWEARKQAWMDELQPRPSVVEDAAIGLDPVVAANDNDDDDDEVEHIVEIRVDGGIFADWDDNIEQNNQALQPGLNNGEDVARPGAEPDEEDRGRLNAHQFFEPGQAPVGDDPAVRVDPAAAPAPQIPDNRQPAAGVNVRAHEREILYSPSGIAQAVLGALLFPTLASLAGETLKLVLPTSWSRGAGAQRTFLQAKWARTLVGGCLLVLGRDALVLYVRWKLARMQRGRRVLDYPGPVEKRRV